MGETGSRSYGVIGNSQNSTYQNIGGYFSSSSTNSSTNYGVCGETTSGNYCYGVYGTAYGGTSASYAGYFEGLLYASSTSFPSDQKLKENVEPVDNAIDKVLKLAGKKYNYKTSTYKDMRLPEGTRYGFLAQDVEQFMPELVRTIHAPPHRDPPKKDENGNIVPQEPSKEPGQTFKSVDYIEIIPLLAEAIKDQQKIINELRNEIRSMKAGK